MRGSSACSSTFCLKLADIDAEILRIFRMRRSPDRRENLLMGHHAAGVLARNDSSSNSFGVSLSSAPARVARWRTEWTSSPPTFSTGISDFRCMRWRKAVRESRQKFTDVERLVDVVVGAQIERLDLLGLALARRQHNDWHIRPFARPFDHVLTVAVRQTEIEAIRYPGNSAAMRFVASAILPALVIS